MISRTKRIEIDGEVTESTNRVVAGGELLMLKRVIDLEEEVNHLEDVLTDVDWE